MQIIYIFGVSSDPPETSQRAHAIGRSLRLSWHRNESTPSALDRRVVAILTMYSLQTHEYYTSSMTHEK